jgi:nucleoid-associated protein YgaU
MLTMKSLSLVNLTTFKKLISAGIIFNGLLLTGCTMFSGGANQLEDPGFRQKVAPAQNAVPLPVEIAKDIERISEDGLLIYSNNPSYTDAYGVLAKQVGLKAMNCDGLQADQLIACEENNRKFLAQEINLSEGQAKESESKKSVSGAEVDTLISENDFIVKEDVGPLRQSLGKKKSGPLNFRSKISGSKLEPLTGGKTVNYVVRLGDTLMKIAFEKYANYLRWKDIYKINQNKMLSPEKMKVGTELTIKNVKYIYIKRDGQPYLIKKMDTLKSISQSLYGTPDRWKEIWKNNPQLIQNPKKIYAGFTLYYPSKSKPSVVEQRLPTSSSKAEEH